MSDKTAFIAAIRANPDAAGPRLVYADWLEEQGESAAAELIRCGVQAARPCRPLIRLDFVHEFSEFSIESLNPIRFMATVNRDDLVHAFDVRVLIGHRFSVGGLSHNKLVDVVDDAGERAVNVKVANVDDIAARILYHPADVPPDTEARRAVTTAKARIHHLEDYHTEAELYGLPDVDDGPEHLTTDRGLVVGLRCSFDYWSRHGDAILGVQPVAKVELTTRPQIDWFRQEHYQGGSGPIVTEFKFLDLPQHLTTDLPLFPRNEARQIIWDETLPMFLGSQWPGVEFTLLRRPAPLPIYFGLADAPGYDDAEDNPFTRDMIRAQLTPAEPFNVEVEGREY